MQRILITFGTRPEAIKMAPVIRELSMDSQTEICVCVTGQHREMLDQVMKFFDIVADYDLAVMKEGQDLTDVTATVLLGFRDVLQQVKPDLVLVQGDTTSAFVAALAAYYAQIPVGHIEAGLRTGNIYAPFPEEINRTLISQIAQLHFAPTEQARQNLLYGGVSDSLISVTGNTVVDALLWALELVANKKTHYLGDGFLQQVQNYQNQAEFIILVTGHRRENFGEGFQNICLAIKKLAIKHPEWAFVYPVHLNPNVQGPVNRLLGGINNVHLIQPLDYPAFVYLMTKCDLILTDSGGIQEESPTLKKPTLVMRDVTERREAVESGSVRLVGTNPQTIVVETEKVLTNPSFYQEMASGFNPYGDGQAARRIVSVLRQWRVR